MPRHTAKPTPATPPPSTSSSSSSSSSAAKPTDFECTIHDVAVLFFKASKIPEADWDVPTFIASRRTDELFAASFALGLWQQHVLGAFDVDLYDPFWEADVIASPGFKELRAKRLNGSSAAPKAAAHKRKAKKSAAADLPPPIKKQLIKLVGDVKVARKQLDDVLSSLDDMDGFYEGSESNKECYDMLENLGSGMDYFPTKPGDLHPSLAEPDATESQAERKADPFPLPPFSFNDRMRVVHILIEQAQLHPSVALQKLGFAEADARAIADKYKPFCQCQVYRGSLDTFVENHFTGLAPRELFPAPAPRFQILPPLGLGSSAPVSAANKENGQAV